LISHVTEDIENVLNNLMRLFYRSPFRTNNGTAHNRHLCRKTAVL